QGRYLGDISNNSQTSHLPVCIPLHDPTGDVIATITGSINPDYFQELFRPAHELNPVRVELYSYAGQKLIAGRIDYQTATDAFATDLTDKKDYSKKIAPFTDNLADTVFSNYLPDSEFGTFQQPAKHTNSQPDQIITSYRSTSPLPLVVNVHLDLKRGLAAWHKELKVILTVFIALAFAIAIGGSAIALSLLRKYRMEGQIRLLSSAISSTANAVFITDNQGYIQWTNKAFEQLTGWPTATIANRTPSFLNSGQHDKAFFQHLWQRITAGNVWRGQVTNKTRDGRHVIVDQTITPILDKEGCVSNFIAVHEDVTLRTKAERQVHYLAQHDPLTGLPNRHSFSLALDNWLSGPVIISKAVLLVDLDHFKTINDTLGHQAGDDVLCQVTQRMQTILPEQAQLFRLGGDEFSILLEAIDLNDIIHAVEALLEQLIRPLEFEDSHFTLSGSIGITFGAAGQSSASVLLKQADMAMYKAKHSGRNTFSVFDENMDYMMQRHVELEQGMRDALASNRGFKLAFQPVIRASDLKPVSAEVLMRWQTDDGQWVSPGEFIPVAEDIGLILELGHWQMEQLTTQMRQWQATSLATINISLNVSPVQLARDDIAQRLLYWLNHYGIPTSRITVEITETALMGHSNKVAGNLATLRNQGVQISIDDFGTGYSSLSYISELDAQVLKIDASFVQKIGQHQKSSKVVNEEEVILATIGLARNLNMAVVAEGVETQVQLEFLQQAGVDYLQGYYFAKPMFEPELLCFIEQAAQQNTEPKSELQGS
ncbi:MAG: EAL domain-containing protein, partial [Marinobacterium sp.]|nr:EAL domain-containing protein [Marinobacterium sp.]